MNRTRNYCVRRLGKLIGFGLPRVAYLWLGAMVVCLNNQLPWSAQLLLAAVVSAIHMPCAALLWSQLRWAEAELARVGYV